MAAGWEYVGDEHYIRNTTSGTYICYCKASTNLQYLFGYTSAGGTTMQYDIQVYVEFIGP